METCNDCSDPMQLINLYLREENLSQIKQYVYCTLPRDERFQCDRVSFGVTVALTSIAARILQKMPIKYSTIQLVVEKTVNSLHFAVTIEIFNSPLVFISDKKLQYFPGEPRKANGERFRCW